MIESLLSSFEALLSNVLVLSSVETRFIDVDAGLKNTFVLKFSNHKEKERVSYTKELDFSSEIMWIFVPGLLSNLKQPDRLFSE